MAKNNRHEANSRIAKDTLRRFPNVPLNTLARYLSVQYPIVFADIERARDSLRWWAGQKGKRGRKSATDKSLFREPGSRSFPTSIAPARTPYKLTPGLWLILADIHIPFHSQLAIEAVFEYAHTQKVDGLLLNGDVQDCHALSPWVVDKRDFLMELELVIDFLDLLRQEFPKKPIVWKPGNHEDRLNIYYARFAPQLVGLPTSDMETVLALDHRNITYLDRKQKVMAGKLPIIHGHELRGGNAQLVSPARWLFLKAKNIAMCSHFHRTSDQREKTIQRKDIVTWTTGCTCSLEPDYNPEANNWNWGFALVNLNKDETFEVENKQILDNGKIV